MTCERSESAWEQRTALYKSDQKQNNNSKGERKERRHRQTEREWGRRDGWREKLTEAERNKKSREGERKRKREREEGGKERVRVGGDGGGTGGGGATICCGVRDKGDNGGTHPDQATLIPTRTPNSPLPLSQGTAGLKIVVHNSQVPPLNFLPHCSKRDEGRHHRRLLST